MQIAETERLRLRHFTLTDAPFLLDLLNSPGWIRWIGDRGVRTLEDAGRYIEAKMLDSYRNWGLGMYLVELKNDAKSPVGACGLVRRPGLDDIDIGFAVLPEFEGQGFARESAEAVLLHAREDLGLTKVVAITLPENERSVGLLKRLGLSEVGLKGLNGEELLLMAIEFTGHGSSTG